MNLRYLSSAVAGLAAGLLVSLIIVALTGFRQPWLPCVAVFLTVFGALRIESRTRQR